MYVVELFFGIESLDVVITCDVVIQQPLCNEHNGGSLCLETSLLDYEIDVCEEIIKCVDKLRWRDSLIYCPGCS